jgi:hypothetical protein
VEVELLISLLQRIQSHLGALDPAVADLLTIPAGETPTGRSHGASA